MNEEKMEKTIALERWESKEHVQTMDEQKINIVVLRGE